MSSRNTLTHTHTQIGLHTGLLAGVSENGRNDGVEQGSALLVLLSRRKDVFVVVVVAVALSALAPAPVFLKCKTVPSFAYLSLVCVCVCVSVLQLRLKNPSPKPVKYRATVFGESAHLFSLPNGSAVTLPSKYVSSGWKDAAFAQCLK